MGGNEIANIMQLFTNTGSLPGCLMALVVFFTIMFQRSKTSERRDADTKNILEQIAKLEETQKDQEKRLMRLEAKDEVKKN